MTFTSADPLYQRIRANYCNTSPYTLEELDEFAALLVLLLLRVQGRGPR